MEKKLYVTGDNLEAEMLTDALKQHGIPSYRKDLGPGQLFNLYIGMFGNSGIEVYVPEEAFEEAKSILEGMGLTCCRCSRKCSGSG